MTDAQPRWRKTLLVVLGVAMGALILAEGLGHWAFARGIPNLLEVTGSQNADVYARQGQRFFERGKFDLAAQYGSAAIQRSPVHQKAMRTLGLSQVALGQESQGRSTMQATGRLGWHDVATQTWLMWDALQRGDSRYAILRADALARRGTMAPGLFKVLVAFGGDPRTRDLLMERLHAGRQWRSDFFRFSTAATSQEAAVAETLLRELARGPTPPGRDEVAAIVRRLAALGEFEKAAQLGGDLIGTPPRGKPLGDGDFKAFDLYGGRAFLQTPFEWEFGTTPGATAVVERPDDPADGALYVESNGARDAMLAGKVVRAPAGARRLAFTIRSSDRNAPERFQWELACLSDGSVLAVEQDGSALPSAEPQQRSVAFTVPGGCPFQRLRLMARRADQRSNVSAYFDDVSIS